MAQVGERIGPRAQLGLLHWKEQLLLFADRPTQTFGFNRPVSAQVRDAIVWLEANGSRWLLLSGKALKPCFLPGRAIDMGIRHRQRWWLLNRYAIAPRCLHHGH
jgi:hypothetical protein